MSPGRRAFLSAGVVAAAAGAGWQWWSARLRAERGGTIELPAASDDASELWALKAPQPQGGELDFGALRGKPLVVNFWATWCAPCVKEMPELDRFRRDFIARGGEVVGLAVDHDKAVRDFLQRLPVAFPIAIVGMDGIELVAALGNPQGGLPFSVVADRKGRIVQRRLGATSRPELERWTARL